MIKIRANASAPISKALDLGIFDIAVGHPALKRRTLLVGIRLERSQRPQLRDERRSHVIVFDVRDSLGDARSLIRETCNLLVDGRNVAFQPAVLLLTCNLADDHLKISQDGSEVAPMCNCSRDSRSVASVSNTLAPPSSIDCRTRCKLLRSWRSVLLCCSQKIEQKREPEQPPRFVIVLEDEGGP